MPCGDAHPRSCSSGVLAKRGQEPVDEAAEGAVAHHEDDVSGPGGVGHRSLQLSQLAGMIHDFLDGA